MFNCSCQILVRTKCVHLHCPWVLQTEHSGHYHCIFSLSYLRILLKHFCIFAFWIFLYPWFVNAFETCFCSIAFSILLKLFGIIAFWLILKLFVYFLCFCIIALGIICIIFVSLLGSHKTNLIFETFPLMTRGSCQN